MFVEIERPMMFRPGIAAGWLSVAVLFSGCVSTQPGGNQSAGGSSPTPETNFDVRVLDSVGKPRELTRFQREETGLFTQSGFEIAYYSPSLDGASSECQAISDLQDIVEYAGGDANEVKAAVHPNLRTFEDIYGYKYVLANYPDIKFDRDTPLPNDFANLHVHVALVRFASSDEPKKFVDFLSEYAEPCNRAQSATTTTSIPRPRDGVVIDVFGARHYNYLGLNSDLRSDAGSFYFQYQDSLRASSSTSPDATETFFAVNHLIGAYYGNVLFLAYYDFWDHDEINLGITTEELDAAIYSILEELDLSGES